MIEGLLTRNQKFKDRILGVLEIFEDDNLIFRCYTLELPWKKNQKQISCIPENTYQVVPRFTPKYKNHFHVLNVPNRSYILIHNGAYSMHTKGCILVGDNKFDLDGDGIPDLTHSKDTLKKMTDLIKSPWELTIV